MVASSPYSTSARYRQNGARATGTHEMVQAGDDPTLPPRYVVDSFCQVYQAVYFRQPTVRYMGNHWYNVDGETVHRAALMREIARLKELAAPPPEPKPVSGYSRPDVGLIQRLINRLKNL
jgi:hypothetical protein